MTTENYGLGAFEMQVLLAIRKIGREAYGVPIVAAIKAATGREPSYGALYTTLERLEKKGWIASRWGEATPERGGRRKKYVEATGAGQIALAEALRGLDALRSDGFVWGGALVEG